MRRAIRVVMLVLLALGATIGAAPAAVIRDDFRVDQSGDIDQPEAARIESLPSVAADSAGNFIVTWRADGHMYARQFDPGGIPVTDQFRVDVDDPGVTAEYPRVVMQPDGRYAYFYCPETEGGLPIARYLASAGSPDGSALIAWTAVYPQEYHVWVRPFDRDGNPLADEVRLDQGDPAYEALFQHLASDPAGVFTVVWMDNQHANGGQGDRSDMQIYARRAGDPARAEFRVDSGPAGSILFGLDAHFQIPDVAASSGTLVFTWIDNRPVDSQHPATIFARVLSNPPDSGS